MYVYSFKSMNITDGEVNGSENPNIWVYWVCILSVFKKKMCIQAGSQQIFRFDKIRLGRGHHMVES